MRGSLGKMQSWAWNTISPANQELAFELRNAIVAENSSGEATDVDIAANTVLMSSIKRYPPGSGDLRYRVR